MLDILGGTIIVCILLLVGYLYLVPRPENTTTCTVPGLPPRNSAVGNFPDIQRCGSMYEFLSHIHQKFGPIASFWWGPKFTVSIASPKLFAENQRTNDRPPELFANYVPFLGPKSFAFHPGEDYQPRHAAYSKCFSFDALRSHYAIFNALSNDLVESWSSFPSGERIPLKQECLAYTIKAVLQGIMGDFFVEQNNVQRIWEAYSVVWTEMEQSVKLGDPEPGSDRQKNLDEQMAKLLDLMKKSVQHRKENPPRGDQFLAIDAIIEYDMPEDVLLKDLLTVFILGFHTTGTLLTWALYYLARHPSCQDKVHEELVKVLGNENLDEENIADLEYTQQVIYETMRCSVLTSLAFRIHYSDTRLGGHAIPANTPIVHALGVVLQDPELYPEPTKFDPERFNRKELKKRPAFSFEPFGFGKRKCFGYRFALMESKISLSKILRAFAVSLPDNQVATQEFGLVTEPKENLYITINKRLP